MPKKAAGAAPDKAGGDKKKTEKEGRNNNNNINRRRRWEGEREGCFNNSCSHRTGKEGEGKKRNDSTTS